MQDNDNYDIPVNKSGIVLKVFYQLHKAKILIIKYIIICPTM